jgi:hypothetical protein
MIKYCLSCLFSIIKERQEKTVPLYYKCLNEKSEFYNNNVAWCHTCLNFESKEKEI